MALVGEIVATRQVAIGDMAGSVYCHVAVYDDSDPRAALVGTAEIELRQEQFMKLHPSRGKRDEIITESVARKSAQVLDQAYAVGKPSEGLIGLVIPLEETEAPAIDVPVKAR